MSTQGTGSAPKASTGPVSGSVKKNEVKQGTHEAYLYGFKSVRWSKTQANVTEKLTLTIETVGQKNGTAAIVDILERDQNSSDKLLATLKLTISGDAATTTWSFPRDRWDKAKPATRPSLPTYLFCCKLGQKVMYSGQLMLTGNVTISVVDRDGKPLNGESVRLWLANGSIRDSKSDNSGKVVFAGIPVGGHQVEFPRNPMIGPPKPIVVESPLKSRRYSLSFFDQNSFAEGFIARCSHRVDERYRMIINPQVFSVVPDLKAPDTVDILTNRGRTLTNREGKGLRIENQSGLVINKIDCNRIAPNTGIPFFPAFWERFLEQTEYNISGLGKPFSIRAYAPDQYKLSLSFPRIAKFSPGSKLGRAEGATEEFLKKDVPGKLLRNKFKVEPEAVENPWTLPKRKPIPATADRPISYFVNNRQVEVKAVEVFGMILKLAKDINRIMDLITDNIPATGLYYESDLKILEGSLCFEWGWKEHIDHRVFPWMAVSFDLTLIQIAIEIGIGIKSWVTRLQLFARIEGSITAQATLERSSPDISAGLKLPAGVNIEGHLGARFQAGAIVKIEAKGTTGLEFKGLSLNISTEKGFSFEIGSLNWTGLKASVSVSSGVGNIEGCKEENKDQRKMTDSGSASREKEFLPPKELVRGFKWPRQEEYIPQYAPRERIREIIHKVLSKENPVSIFRTGPTVSLVPLPEVAAEIEKNIDKLKKLDKGEKPVEGIAHALRDALLARTEALGSGSKGVEHSKFMAFCQSGDFKQICSRAQDTYLASIDALAN